MKMPTLSVRLPSDTSVRLEKAAKSTHRSRSFLVKEALERHLNEIVQEQTGQTKSRMARLLEMQGVGSRLYGERTQEDIDAQIREFRGDE